MKIIMLGAPGAGKGTQAKKIAEKYSIQSVPTSILFKNNNIVERISGLISFNQCSDLVDKYLK